jgi:hypothetical protein
MVQLIHLSLSGGPGQRGIEAALGKRVRVTLGVLLIVIFAIAAAFWVGLRVGFESGQMFGFLGIGTPPPPGQRGR